MASSSNDVGFKTLNADDIDHTVTEIESCCMNCYENVSHNLKFRTRLLRFKHSVCFLFEF